VPSLSRSTPLHRCHPTPTLWQHLTTTATTAIDRAAHHPHLCHPLTTQTAAAPPPHWQHRCLSQKRSAFQMKSEGKYVNLVAILSNLLILWWMKNIGYPSNPHSHIHLNLCNGTLHIKSIRARKFIWTV